MLHRNLKYFHHEWKWCSFRLTDSRLSTESTSLLQVNFHLVCILTDAWSGGRNDWLTFSRSSTVLCFLLITVSVNKWHWRYIILCTLQGQSSCWSSEPVMYSTNMLQCDSCVIALSNYQIFNGLIILWSFFIPNNEDIVTTNQV